MENSEKKKTIPGELDDNALEDVSGGVVGIILHESQIDDDDETCEDDAILGGTMLR